LANWQVELYDFVLDYTIRKFAARFPFAYNVLGRTYYTLTMGAQIASIVGTGPVGLAVFFIRLLVVPNMKRILGDFFIEK